MALVARIIDTQREGDCVSLAAEYFDSADPETVLFTSPRWAFEADAPEEEIDTKLAEYGRTRDLAEEAALSLAGRTVEVIDDYQPSAGRVEAVKAEIAAQAEADAAAAEAARQAEAEAARAADAAAGEPAAVEG